MTATGTKALAGALGLTSRRVQQLASRGMPRNLAGARRWIAKRDAALARQRDGVGAGRTDLARARFAKRAALAQRAERRLKRRARELVHAQAAEESLRRYRNGFGAVVLTLPERLAAVAIPAGVAAATDAVIEIAWAAIDAARGVRPDLSDLTLDVAVVAGRGTPASERAARTRQLEAEAALLDLEARLADGDLVPMADIERRHARHCDDVRGFLVNVPGRLGVRVAGATPDRVRAATAEEVAQFLVGWSK